MRNVDASFETSGWGPGTPPWRSILPAEGNPYADVAEALLDHFGTASGCLAWVSEDTIREHLPFDAHVHRLEPPLLEAGSRLQGEDPHDRPGATLGRYDGAVVWAVSENDLAERVTRAWARPNCWSWTPRAQTPGGLSPCPGRARYGLGTGRLREPIPRHRGASAGQAGGRNPTPGRTRRG